MDFCPGGHSRRLQQMGAKLEQEGQDETKLMSRDSREAAAAVEASLSI